MTKGCLLEMMKDISDDAEVVFEISEPGAYYDDIDVLKKRIGEDKSYIVFTMG
jgi:hypothetical protein